MTVDRAVSENMIAAYVIAMPVGDDCEAADAKLPFKVLAQPFGLARHPHGINHDGLTAVVDDVATTAKAHIHIGVRRVATPIEVDQVVVDPDRFDHSVLTVSPSVTSENTIPLNRNGQTNA